ncbi:MAG: glycosyltransferase [Alistipes sp.]|nr:glycosyltransferase [Alistipes sp.]
MHIYEYIITELGATGVALAAAAVVLFFVQIIYYFRYGRLVGYKLHNRKPIREAEPPLSLIVPMFSEDYGFVEERLPLFMQQEYTHYEVVVVYVGQNSDFHEELTRCRQHYPNLIISRIHHDPRYPISRKMALNIGIKSAHYECLLFTSTEVEPASTHWLALMAKGFARGEIVVGYCGLEAHPSLQNRMMRTSRLMDSADWISRATTGRPHRGILHNFGFTKSLYFSPEVNGFNRLNMNIGEDDLFMQEIMPKHTVSVVLSPKASVKQKLWGGISWWISQCIYYDASRRHYPLSVRLSHGWELISRLLFFGVIAASLILLPDQFRIAAGVLLLLRYLFVIWEVRRMSRRLGERGLVRFYFIYDLLSPFWSLAKSLLLLRHDDRVWR